MMGGYKLIVIDCTCIHCRLLYLPVQFVPFVFAAFCVGLTLLFFGGTAPDRVSCNKCTQQLC